MSEYGSMLDRALAASRTRASWNDRLSHWERPASDTEEAKIERAARIARDLVGANQTLINEMVSIRPQGSYFNNTNVRLEADMDLRVQLPWIWVEYADGVDAARANAAAGYVYGRRTLNDIANIVRNELARDCRRHFGDNAVTVGTKAVTVDGLDGSRADVDLVPAFRFHWIVNDGRGGFHTTEGVMILGANGSRTVNFPEQHHLNGIAKRHRTQHRFKKVVRMLKQLNYELAEHELIPNRVPSFLVECLVYLVDDIHFLLDEDRYDRLQRVCSQIATKLQHMNEAAALNEINEVKFLFHTDQAWTLAQARSFVSAALARLES